MKKALFILLVVSACTRSPPDNTNYFALQHSQVDPRLPVTKVPEVVGSDLDRAMQRYAKVTAEIYSHYKSKDVLECRTNAVTPRWELRDLMIRQCLEGKAIR